MSDDLVRPRYVRDKATMLLAHEGIRQPRRDPGPWRQSIPLSAEERQALLVLAFLREQGLLRPRADA